ncbi:Synaptotagmin 1, partial [Geodia barretti]
SYLSPEKSVDSVDGVVLHRDSKSLGYNPFPVFQFPQAPQKFPTHPALPFKPRQIELRQPQMKFTPGAGTGRVIIPQTDSPFPAPYLQGRGPGMQTPFSEVPIQCQPRTAFQINRGTGSIQVATATTQGRQMSLPAPHMITRGRKRIFSMAGKQTVGGYEGMEDERLQRRKRLMHRARTVGSSPSQQPTIDAEKLRRCQTPDFSLEDTDKLKPREGKKGLALRKCKTPDTIMMRGGSKRDGGGVGEGGTKRFSESPETEGSSSLTASPESKSGGHPEDEREVEGEEEEGGKEERGFRGAASAAEHMSVAKVLSLDSGRRRLGSWRERLRKDPGSPQEGASKSAKIPSHITSSTSAYLLSSGIAAGDTSGAEVTSTTDENPPYIYFSLYFDIQRRALMVNLIKVENLPLKPPNQGSCDPFVMLFLLPNKQEVLQSVVKQRTLNPEFQQVFEFGGILANDLKNQVLVFRVFDHDRFSKNDLMGTVIMPLKDADLYGVLMRRPVDQRKGLLKQFSAGDLLFSLTYSEERRVINGIILKATNLRKADIWGLAGIILLCITHLFKTPLHS